MSSARQSHWNISDAWTGAKASSTCSTITPKCISPRGVARGRHEIERLFGDLMGILAGVSHDIAYVNFVQQGDMVVVEGWSSGKLKNGAEWRAGTTHAGSWCDVFEIRDFSI